MKMHIESVRHAGSLKEQLVREGWRVDNAQGGGFLISHGEIASELDARQRLQRMGLLTSGKVRIEFLFSPADPGDGLARRHEDVAFAN
jgi:hypothetical protein